MSIKCPDCGVKLEYVGTTSDSVPHIADVYACPFCGYEEREDSWVDDDGNEFDSQTAFEQHGLIHQTGDPFDEDHV